MTPIVVSKVNADDLSPGYFFRFANKNANGYGLLLNENFVAILSGTGTFELVDKITVLGGWPVLRIDNQVLFEPSLDTEQVIAGLAPAPGEVIYYQDKKLLKLRNPTQFVDLDSKQLFILDNVPYDECVLVKSWFFKAHSENLPPTLLFNK